MYNILGRCESNDYHAVIDSILYDKWNPSIVGRLLYLKMCDALNE